MKGEFEKSCWEQGDYSPYPRSVGEQWRWTLEQVVSGVRKEDREEEAKAIKRLWKESQEQKKMPPPEMNVSLTDGLQWESEIHKILQNHLDNPKTGFIAGKNRVRS